MFYKYGYIQEPYRILFTVALVLFALRFTVLAAFVAFRLAAEALM